MANPRYNLVYESVQPYLSQVLLAFPCPRPDQMDTFDYVQTRLPDEKYPLFPADGRYSGRARSGQDSGSLGPVEAELSHFLKEDKKLNVLVLVGSLGCGKSTTLRYVMHHFLTTSEGHSHYVDFDDFLPKLIGAATDGDEAGLGVAQSTDSLSYDAQLVANLTEFAGRYLDPEEEIKAMWTWALGLKEHSRDHLASIALHRARETLRAQGGGPQGDKETDALIALRRKERKKIIEGGDLVVALTYQCLRLDYLVTCRFRGDPRRIVLILDNVDPLPSAFHLRVLNIVQRVSQQAHCKVILSLRPPTYASTTDQGGGFVYHRIEHAGPSIDSLLKRRFRAHILDLSDSDLRRALTDSFAEDAEDAPRRAITRVDDEYAVAYEGAAVPFSCIRGWLRAVYEMVVKGRSKRSADLRAFPDAHHVMRGVCGYSIRQAKLLTLKVLQSQFIPVCEVVGGKLDIEGVERDTACRADNARVPAAHPGAARELARRLHHREVIRAMLVWSQGEFKPLPNRVFDNIYRCSSRSPRGLTCKLRILHFVASGGEGAVYDLREVLRWTSLFYYDEATVQAALNAMVSMYKRLLWCDSALRFEIPLTAYANARVSLAPPGRYYIDFLSCNPTYVQEMLRSSDANIASRAESAGMVGRVRDLRHFLQELFKQDADEVQAILYQGASAHQYNRVHGTQLFSERIIEAARRNIGAQLSGERISGWSSEAKGHAEAELAAWDNYFIEEQVQPTLRRLRRHLQRWQLLE